MQVATVAYLSPLVNCWRDATTFKEMQLNLIISEDPPDIEDILFYKQKA